MIQITLVQIRDRLPATSGRDNNTKSFGQRAQPELRKSGPLQITLTRFCSEAMQTPNEKAEKLQRGGQDAYRKKQFELAMKLFSQALGVSGLSATLRIRILDNRAATQEKLGGDKALRTALADAKMMIQLQKAGANGYLRAGKILQLQGSDKLALDLYKYGLKRIATNDDDGKKVSGWWKQRMSVFELTKF